MQHLQPNSTLQGGKYKIEKVLGQGGFGITYLAEQVMLGRKVAVKEFFMKELCDRDESTSHVTLGTEGSRETVNRFREKFLKEARNIARLSHPNIVRIIDVFEENGTAYYVMEYAESGSLADRVKREGYLSEPVATRYILQVAEALEYVHQQKMNHLDVKPANIMLNEKDESVIIDFGLSKQYDATTGNQTSTTPVGISEGYAPMEQYKQGGVGEFSPETDIYALGATFFKLLTGKTPPSASDVNEDGVPVSELKSKGVSDNAIAVICKAMEGRKRDRMKSVQEFIKGLVPDSIEAQSKNPNIDESTISVESEITPTLTSAPPVKEKQEDSNNKIKTISIVAAVMIAVVGLACYLFIGGKESIQDFYVENDTIYLKSLPEVTENVLDAVVDCSEDESDAITASDYMVYTGQVRDNLPNGHGEASFFANNKYIGKYVGEFVNGHFHGEKGVLTDTLGFTYESSFVNGYLAKGKYTLTEDGEITEVFKGIFVNNAPCTGTFYDGDGNMTIKIEHRNVVWYDADAVEEIGDNRSTAPQERNVCEPKHKTAATESAEDNTIYIEPDQAPTYPGGLSASYSFLTENLKYPSSALEDGIQGKVFVGFVVEKDGAISNVEIVKSVSPDLDKEAMRVVRLMPNFIPAKNKGETVRAKVVFPITFKLN